MLESLFLSYNAIHADRHAAISARKVSSRLLSTCVVADQEHFRVSNIQTGNWLCNVYLIGQRLGLPNNSIWTLYVDVPTYIHACVPWEIFVRYIQLSHIARSWVEGQFKQFEFIRCNFAFNLSIYAWTWPQAWGSTYFIMRTHVYTPQFA